MADDPIFSDVTINGKKEKFADPQHFTGEGNDGRAKTGENNPLPTKDGEVRSELESIKQTQTEILDKLNGTIDTKLTGSNVEDIKTGSYKVSAGSSRFVRLFEHDSISKYKWIFLVLEPDKIHDFKLLISLKDEDGMRTTEYTKLPITEADRREKYYATEKVEVTGDYVNRVQINNDSDEDINYNIKLKGVMK